MTTGDLLLSLSSLATGTTLQHLMSIVSSGSITWLPTQTITADMNNDIVSASIGYNTTIANIDDNNLSANLLIDDISLNVLEQVYGANIQNNTMEINYEPNN